MDRASVASDGTSTVASRILIQNGSFFYPKKPGFRRTAVYTASFGEKSLKKYMHGPGGKAHVSLGTDKATMKSTMKDTYRKAGKKEEVTKSRALPLAGCPSEVSSRAERRTKNAQPPGGRTAVLLGTDENPTMVGVFEKDMSAAADPAARSVADATCRAGRPNTSDADAATAEPRFAKKPLQNVGGDTKLYLGPAESYPEQSLMAEDLALAFEPALQSAADAQPRRGITSETADELAHTVRRRTLAPASGGCDSVQLRDSSNDGFPQSSLWEADIQRGLNPALAEEAENMPAAGERVVPRPPSVRVSRITGGTSTITLQYASERDNESALLSPVRPKGLPLNATQTHGGMRRVTNIGATGCVGPSLIGGISAGAESRWKTTYQSASTGERPHESRPRRALVKRVQNVGGRTTVSLRDDADAAGVRTKLEPEGNPITARTPNPITAPPPPRAHTGRRLVRPQPLPDQVAITADDIARINARESRRMSIRPVAPPGGVSTVKIC